MIMTLETENNFVRKVAGQRYVYQFVSNSAGPLSALADHKPRSEFSKPASMMSSLAALTELRALQMSHSVESHDHPTSFDTPILPKQEFSITRLEPVSENDLAMNYVNSQSLQLADDLFFQYRTRRSSSVCSYPSSETNSLTRRSSSESNSLYDLEAGNDYDVYSSSRS